MDLNELLKIKDLNRPRNAFAQMHEETLRSLRSTNAFAQMHEAMLRNLRPTSELDRRSLETERNFSFREELMRTKALGLLDAGIDSSWCRHINGLNESIALRVLREPAFGSLKESALLRAQSQLEQGWQRKLTELTTQLSGQGASRISEEFLGLIKADVLPKFHSYVESETAALRRSIMMAAESPSASAFAALTATINATSFSTTAKWMREMDSTGLMKRMFEPTIAYGQFAARTLELIRNPISHSHRAAMAASLLMADTQAIRTANLLTPLADSYFAPNRQEIVFPRPVINRYRLQREELLNKEDRIPDEPDYEILVPLAPSAESFDIALKCLELIGLCDETNQTSAGESIFKLTPMFVLSFAGLLGTVAQNRVTLAQVVENLYIVLYEAAGKDKLRYLECNYLSHEECEIVWKIKHLRNKWLSHDAEHGSDRDIRESRRLRLEALNWLGLERVPTQPPEYARVHRRLLEKVREFLTLLLARIAQSDEMVN